MIFRNLAYRLRLTRMSLQRFSHRFASTVRALGITVDVLTVTAALVCSVGMLIYVGFDHSAGILHSGADNPLRTGRIPV